MSALAVENLEAGYEPGLAIVRGASLSVEAGEIVAIVGPNGAGKSTLAKAIAGLVPIFAGRVRLAGKDIAGVPAHLLARAGLGFVPQTENVFAPLTVAENLELAASVAKMPRTRLDALYALFPDLDRARDTDAGRLSGGQRQMLAMARALVPSPRAIILDEPSAGLSPKLVAHAFDKLREIAGGGVAVLLIEQNVKAALAIASRTAVLVEGRERLVAPSAELARPGVLEKLFFPPAESAA
ncbi:MAG: ABC transporter ATP-binding protein [Tagaea sp.]|nr:ABC transporter ATP-binding protein [Tagaea sp.]